MKNILTTAAVALFALGAMAQSYTTQVKPAGGKLWGYANETGKIIIPAKYQKCYYFSEGLAAIKENKKFFFIKPDGSLLDIKVKDFRLAKASLFGLQGFSEGMVQIKIKDKWGYLNKDGELAIEAQFDAATRFENGYAIVKTGTDYFVIDKKGNQTKIDVPNIKKVKPFSEGLAPLYNTNGNVGFVNTKGELAIETRFYGAGYFVNGRAWVKNLTKQFGYINTSGEWVIEPKFMACKNFDKSSGLARVKYQDKWAYVTMDGEMVYVKDTEVWGDFYDGLAKGKKNGKLGFYDKTGNYVIEPQFEGVRNFRNGFAAAKLNGKWGIIDSRGEWVIKPEFDGIRDMELMQ